MNQLWAPWRMEYILDAKNESEGCIFCDLSQQNDDQKNLIVYRSEKSFVMLNKFPYNNGHVMVIPYQHLAEYTELTDEILLDMQRVIKKTITAIQKSMEPHGMNIGLNLGRTAGAGIDDHIHYHIVPRWNGDTNFMPVISGTKVVSEALEKTWQKLTEEFSKL
jgi:ATP adenylyltransferase